MTQRAKGCDTAPNALRHGAGKMRHAWQHAVGTCVAIQFCIVTGGEGREAATQHASVLVRAAIRQGTLATRPRGRPRYDQGEACDTVPCALPGRCAQAACTQPRSVGCAPSAPNPVLTQDTVLSYCFGHCS